MPDGLFPPLQFPVTPRLKWQSRDGKYYFWDPRRKKYILLTPEEWVRQHVIAWLESEAYPPELIAVERQLTVNRQPKRFDVVVFDRRNRPFLLTECKRPDVRINEKTLMQALQYNRALKAPYLLLTNGRDHYLWAVMPDREAVALTKLPRFEEYPR